MKNTDVLVIGGSAAGMVAAITGKSTWPDKNFILVKKQKEMMIPCGIPYIFGTLESSNQNLLPVDDSLKKNDIESIVGEVISIDKVAKQVEISGGEIIKYEKLIIATGSTPLIPKWLKGANLKNVFTIPKDKVYLDDMTLKLKDCKNIVVIGAGFIGVEMSDELHKHGYNVTLVEKLPNILGLAFDEEITGRAKDILQDRGIEINLGSGVEKIMGNESVEGVVLDNGKKIVADAVILSMGYRPNVTLAKDAGIPINDEGFIIVDEYMRTNVKNIFAVGDCAEKRDFITRRKTPTMLASTACAEARIAGLNLFNLHVVKTFSGTIAIYSTAIGEHGFGTAGITESHAVEEGIEVSTGMFEGIDRHPGKLPDTHKQIVKLIAAKNSGVIIGGEVIGGKSTGELTNVIGLAIENRMTINSLLTSQIGTHPCMTASPAGYPLIKAAEIIAKKMRNSK